jgi:hypothetical protein
MGYSPNPNFIMVNWINDGCQSKTFKHTQMVDAKKFIIELFKDHENVCLRLVLYEPFYWVSLIKKSNGEINILDYGRDSKMFADNFLPLE